MLLTLLQIQEELKAPKNQYNNFGKYNYRSTEDILSAVKPLLAKYGDDLHLSDEPVLIGDWHYIKATATFIDKDQKKTTATGYAREPLKKRGMDESQITGTSSSYARKYALNGLFLIDDTKDADTNEYQSQNNNRRPQSPVQRHPQQPGPYVAKGRGQSQQLASQSQTNTASQTVTNSLEEKYKDAVAQYAVLTQMKVDEANAVIAKVLKSDKEYMALKDKNAKINKATNVVNIMIQQAQNGGNK